MAAALRGGSLPPLTAQTYRRLGRLSLPEARLAGGGAGRQVFPLPPCPSPPAPPPGPVPSASAPTPAPPVLARCSENVKHHFHRLRLSLRDRISMTFCLQEHLRSYGCSVRGIHCDKGREPDTPRLPGAGTAFLSKASEISCQGNAARALVETKALSSFEESSGTFWVLSHPQACNQSQSRLGC